MATQSSQNVPNVTSTATCGATTGPIANGGPILPAADAAPQHVAVPMHNCTSRSCPFPRGTAVLQFHPTYHLPVSTYVFSHHRNANPVNLNLFSQRSWRISRSTFKRDTDGQFLLQREQNVVLVVDLRYFEIFRGPGKSITSPLYLFFPDKMEAYSRRGPVMAVIVDRCPDGKHVKLFCYLTTIEEIRRGGAPADPNASDTSDDDDAGVALLLRAARIAHREAAAEEAAVNAFRVSMFGEAAPAAVPDGSSQFQDCIKSRLCHM
jgi:hypothetical protein